MTSTTTTEITETTEAETTTKTTTFLDNTDYDTDYDKKFKLVTFGLRNYCTTLLKKLSTQNASTIVDYLQALNTEVNPSLSYKANQVKNLTYLSLFCKQKSFVEITRDDILAYLDTIKRPEESDPL